MAVYAQQIAAASVNGQGKFFSPGHYDLRVRQCLCKRGEDPSNPGDFFIVEFEILATTDLNNHPVGSMASFSRNMIKSTSHGDIKGLFLGLAGLGQQDHSMDPYVSKILMRVVESDNPLMGMSVHLEAFLKLSKKQRDPNNPNQGKPFTVHNWTGGTSGAQLAQIASSQSVGYTAPPPQAMAAIPPAAYSSAPYGAPPQQQQPMQAPQGWAPPAQQQAPGPYPNPFGAPQGAPPPSQWQQPQQPMQAPPIGGQPPPGTRLAPGIVMGPNGQPIAG